MEKVDSYFKAEYIQDGDSCGGGEYQTLKIEQEDAGGGKFFVIKTSRWAVDKMDELVKILQDFERRVRTKVKSS